MKKFKTFLVSSLALVGLAACNPQNSGSVDIINSTQPSVSVIDPSTTPAPSTTPTPSTSTSVTEPVEWPADDLLEYFGVEIPKLDASNYTLEDYVEYYGVYYVTVSSPSADACETYATKFGNEWKVDHETDEESGIVYYEAIYSTGYEGVDVLFYIENEELVIQISSILLKGNWPTVELKTIFGDSTEIPEYEAGAKVYYDETYFDSYGCVAISFESTDADAEFASYSETLKAANWKVKVSTDEEYGDTYYAVDSAKKIGIMYYVDSEGYFTIDVYEYDEEIFGTFSTLDENYNGEYIAYTADQAKATTIQNDVVSIGGVAWTVTAENNGVYTMTTGSTTGYMKEINGNLILSSSQESFDDPIATIVRIEDVVVPAELRGEYTGTVTVVVSKSAITLEGGEAQFVKKEDTKYIVFYQDSLYTIAFISVEGVKPMLVMKDFFTDTIIATLTMSSAPVIVEDSIFDFTAKPAAKSATDDEVIYELENATFKISKGKSSTNANNYLAEANGKVRVYAKQVITITVNQGTIDTVEFEGTVAAKLGDITAAVVTGGTLTETSTGITIAAEAGTTEITITLPGTSGNFQITKVSVLMA